MKKNNKKSIINNNKLKERALKPPQFNMNCTVSARRRFVASAAFNGVITDRSLLGILGNICTTTNSVLTTICATSKLHSIEIWSPPPAQGSSATVSVEWYGLSKKSSIVSDTSINPLAPAYIKCKPPKDTLNSFWLGNLAQNVFGLICPIGSIIDIQLTGVFSDLVSISNQQTVATATNTVLYYSYLDAQTPSHVLVPQVTNATF